MLIEQRVRELKDIIAASDGTNAADRKFARAVDDMISAVYDGIGEISTLPSRPLFDLFVIKVLYVGRHSRDAGIIDYIGALLEACIDARRVFPPDEHGRLRRLYFSDMLDREKHPRDEPDVYEAYRRYADSALFLTGVFRPSVRTRTVSRTHLRRRGAPAVDHGYYVATGREMYLRAAEHHHRGCAHEPRTLAMLGDNFELYADALQEVSERYIMGFDLGLISNKMLDAMNAGHPAESARYQRLLESA